MVKAVELDIKLQKLANDNSTASSPASARRYGQLHFDRTDYSVVIVGFRRIRIHAPEYIRLLYPPLFVTNGTNGGRPWVSRAGA